MRTKLFRAVSANDNDRCVSYSTYEKAYAKLQEWCDKYGYELEQEPYDVWYHNQLLNEAKCCHNFRGWSSWGTAYAFTIVEFKTPEEYEHDLLEYSQSF